MSTSTPTRFDALTGLRALAASWVLGYHLRFYFPPGTLQGDLWSVIFIQGYLGVDLFFVLSGFVLMHNYGDRALHRDGAGYLDYLRNRLARVYPAHLATLLMLVGIVWTVRDLGLPLRDAFRYSLDGFVRNLLLIQAWDFPVTHSWNINAWSISAEWAAYLCFPPLAWLASRLRSNDHLLLAVLGCWVALHLFVTNYRAPNPGDYALPRVFAAFTAGLLIHRLWRNGWAKDLPWAWIALTSAVAMALVGGLMPGRRPEVLTFAAPFGCLIVYGLARDSSGWGAWLSTPRMVFWGGASYALFLVHRVVIIGLQHFYPARGLGQLAQLWALAVVVISFVLAALLFVWLEEPARQYLRRRPAAATS